MSDCGADVRGRGGSARMPLGAVLVLSAAVWPQAALAAPGDPVEIVDDATLDPILSARLRYESVDRAGMPNLAEAFTLRARAGAELDVQHFSILAETEGTVALIGDYNDTLPGNGVEPFASVADPENFELNRLQVSWMKHGTGVTLGRQRITLDDQRFVGNGGWRQNEQTFDAVRGQAQFGPIALDAAYAISQRTVFGVDSPNARFDGQFVLLNAGVTMPTMKAKAFAYLIDYDTRAAFSSQTYGLLAAADIPLAGIKLSAQARYASQSNYGANPLAYRADYFDARLSAAFFGFNLSAGYEELGSDGGVAAFQTPLASAHAHNGSADIFTITPPTGLRDFSVAAGHTFEGIPALPGLEAAVTYHRFDSDFGGLDYGNEWNASLGFRLGPATMLAKYANYDAEGFAADTEKFWLQAEIGF